MKRVIEGILFGLVILSQPITASANGLSPIPNTEVEGVTPEVQQIAEIIGNEFNICPELLEAIAFNESRCTADAKNGPCLGLMQVNVKVHKERFEGLGWSTDDWDDAYKNMYVSASYLSDLFEQYEDVGIVLGLYHGEKDAISKGQQGQLSSYTTEILKRSEALERAHGK